MSEISNLLDQKVDEYRQSIGVVSDDSWDLVKSAAVEALTNYGIPEAEYVVDELAKQAGYGETRSVANSFSFDANEVLNVMEKAASYVSELEAKIEAKEEAISGLQVELEKVASVNNEEVVNALIEKGFSEEDANNLVDLPSETLNKVASMANGEPWEMGKGGRQAEDGLDAFTKFLIS